MSKSLICLAGIAVLLTVSSNGAGSAQRKTIRLSENGKCLVTIIKGAGDEFAAGHVPGSVNIALSGQFASWAGTVLGLSSRPVLIGESSEQLSEARMRLARDEEGFSELLDLLATATIDYVKEQIAGGVDAVMLFDTQAGCLPPAEFSRAAIAFADRVLRSIPKSTPTIYFALASSNGQLDAMRAIHADVIGLDYRVSLSQARAILGSGRSVQGNLDPAALLLPPEQLVARAEAVLRENGGRPGFIFNLGHGIYPETPVENVALLVETVRRHRNAARRIA